MAAIAKHAVSVETRIVVGAFLNAGGELTVNAWNLRSILYNICIEMKECIARKCIFLIDGAARLGQTSSQSHYHITQLKCNHGVIICDRHRSYERKYFCPFHCIYDNNVHIKNG